MRAALLVVVVAAALLTVACRNECPVRVTRGDDGRWHISNDCR